MTAKPQSLGSAHPNVPRTVLQAEQARLLYAGIPVSLTVNALIAAILVIFLRNALYIGPVVLWSAVLGTTLLLRAMFTVGYRHSQANELAGTVWLTRFRIGTATTGVAWGLASFLLFPADDIPHQSFLAFAIAGMTAGAVTSLSIDLASSLAFIIPTLVPLIARVLAEGGEIPVAMGAMGTLYLAALILISWRTYLNARENICLQFEAVTREHALRESEAQLIRAQEVAQTGSWNLDIAHNDFTWSRQICQIFGISPGTPLAYETLLGYVHPDDRQKVDAAWTAALHGAPYDIEHRIVVDGQTRWVRECAQVECDPELRPLSASGTVQDITERKKNNDTLRLHSEILRNLSEGIFLIRASDGMIVFTNPQFERMFGYGPGELIGKHMSTVNAPGENSPEAVAAAINSELARSGVWSDDVHNIRKDGTTFWCHASASAFDHPQFGKVWVAVHEDITERKQIQEALSEREKSYRTLFESSRDAIMTASPDRGFLSGNAAAVALFGCRDEQEFVTLSPALTSPAFQSDGRISDEKAQEMMQTALKNGSHFFEWTHRRMDGTEFAADVLLTRMEVGGKKLIQATVRDITQRKQAEEALRIAAIAFESQEGIIVTDANGVIMRVNQAFTRLTGYSAEEAVGQTPALLNSGRQGKEFYENMWATLKQKHHWQGEIWNRRKNGKIYAEWLTISAVTAPDGSITHYVGTFSNITNDPEASAEIHRLAYYDPLTHLPNRRLLMDRLAQALASSQRSGRYGALLFLDLDNFKKLNDTRGHDVGDQLLIEVAQRLNACVREGDTVVRLGDTVVRLGGDEFVLMLEDLGEHAQEAAIQAGHVGEKVREAISLPYVLKGAEFTCSVSIGISLFFDHNESVEDLLKYADLAMYHAKKGGRNRLSFFDPAMQTALIEHSTLENDLRHALDRKQLRLYYQIQIDSEHRVAGAEALLRWQHPERGLIKPGKFIPLAEETGLIIPIGLWVLQNACAQLKAWSDDPATRDLQLAINVSVRQFHQPDFVAQVQQVIAGAGINPERLKIELTESLVLDNANDAITKMHALKSLGVSFSMDDFGTGYSSLSNLQQLPLHQLKIDQSFVRDLTTNPNDAAIVQAIVTMGLAFGMNVIAEGVETETQREFLDLLGCHAFQGYLFNQPMPINEFETLMAQYA